eukprot:3934639-Karenia_brevis.AAC.1
MMFWQVLYPLRWPGVMELLGMKRLLPHFGKVCNMKDECEDDAPLTKVVLKNSAGNHIDFGHGPLTTTGLLDIIDKQFEEQNVKFEYTQPKPPREEMVEVRDLLSHHDIIAHCFR